MIEVVAIDNRNAEAELLRLAAQFAAQRLLQPKQKKRLISVVEVTGEGAPRPTSRAQMAQKPGLFKSSKFHFDCAVSLAHGFEVAVLQLMHEFVHHAQIINNRYQLAAKVIKKDGEKHTVFQARWLGKKQGLIDDLEWQDRPWEQEASRLGEQLAGEFTALLYGTQSHFAAMGRKKELRLYDVSLALPMMAASSAPQTSMVEPPEPQISAPLAPMVEPPASDMAIPDNGATQQAPDDIFGDIDALLAADTSQNVPADSDINPASDFAFGAPQLDQPSFDAPPSYDDHGSGDEKRTYVAGIAEPRHLKLSVLEAKRRELQARGLLEN